MNESELNQEKIEQGKRLKRLRTLFHLNQDEFARALGYSRASINYWENAQNAGLTIEGALTVIELCQKLGAVCNLTWLLYGKDAPPYLAGEISANQVKVNQSETISQDSETVSGKNDSHRFVFHVTELDAFFPFSPGDQLAGHWVGTHKWKSKKIVLAVISDETDENLILCKIQQMRNKKFFKFDRNGKDKQIITLDKFVLITQWQAQ